MQIYPAIDIKDGRVVRLVEGEHLRETPYATEPEAQAEAFATAGATWLHIVDLDRAFDTGKDNTAVLRRITRLPNISVQVGGNLRTTRDVQIALEAGAARAIVGTAAVTIPSALAHIIREAGAASLAVALDVRNGKPAVRGERKLLEVSVTALVSRAIDSGVRHVVYKDMARDGLLAGCDVGGAAKLVPLGADVIASGGVSGLAELVAARSAGLAGVIVGRALHEGRFSLEEALACSR